MYRNPKNIKQEIKLFFFYLVDIGIVAGCVFFSYYLAQLLPLTELMKIFLYIQGFCFGVWLCVRTPAHPQERNLNMVFHMLKMDRNSYHDVQFLKNKRGKFKV